MCRNKKEAFHTFLAITIIFVVTVIIWVIDIRMQLNAASIIYGIVLDALKLATIPMAPLLSVAVTRVIRSGILYNYTANEEKMLITCPKLDLRADIYYKNVLHVEYENIMFLGKIRGYNVTIYSKDGTFTFNYLFPAKDTIRTPDITPFRIIEERAGLLEKPEFYTGKRIDNAGMI